MPQLPDPSRPEGSALLRVEGSGIPRPEASGILRLEGIVKSFPGVQAIRRADLELFAGEIHALVGENGAGKSTLIRVVSGAHSCDEGTLWIAGQPRRFRSPCEAARAGIAAIYQEFSLVPALTVRENLFLGREHGKLGILLDSRREGEGARQVLARLGSTLDPETRVADLSVAEQQRVEIARALLAEARVLILDEPTAALTPAESAHLFHVLADLRRRGVGILLVSHRLEEVLRVADRVTVMRDGMTLGTWPASELTRETLITKMVGRSLDEELPKRSRVVEPAPGSTALGRPVVLEARGLRGGRVRDVSFRLYRGEILGLAGLAGSGRTEVARFLFGADPLDAGEILLEGKPVTIRSPREAIARGLCLLTEDRKAQGLALGLSAQENFALPNLGRWSLGGWIRQMQEDAAFRKHAESLRIRLSSSDQPARDLSGGNQQKLLVARWLESNARILLFDEPTRGIDVGARHEMHVLMHRLADQGRALILISSDLPELLGLSDRVLVMHEGRITGEILDPPRTTQEQVMSLAVT